jgi:hypothetical protein
MKKIKLFMPIALFKAQKALNIKIMLSNRKSLMENKLKCISKLLEMSKCGTIFLPY